VARVKAGKLVLGWIGVLAFCACGGRADDTTTLIQPAPPPPEPTSFDVASSRTLEALAEPAAREAFCGWVGSSAANLAGRTGSELDCNEVVDRCRAAAEDPALAGSPELPMGLLGVNADVEGLLGCPTSLAEVDACVAELIGVVVARYPEGPACGAAPPAQPLGLQDVVGLRSCLRVAAECPELLQQLLASAG
jgi:hypothetical protein